MSIAPVADRARCMKTIERTGRKIAVAGGTGRVGRHVVEILRAGGHEAISMSRASGVDVVTGEGLEPALAGVECIIDASTGPSPDQAAATAFFEAATHNLQGAGSRAGVRRLVVVSIIGIDRLASGYNVAKLAHERAMLAGPVPAVILRAAQFHELVAQLMEWGRQGDVCYVPKMRTQLVAARAVAEELVKLALAPAAPSRSSDAALIPEIAGPRADNLVDAARLLVRRKGESLAVEEVFDANNPDSEGYASGALLPNPHALLAGPTFAEWLESGGG